MKIAVATNSTQRHTTTAMVLLSVKQQH